MRETVKNTEKVSFKEARKYNYYYRLNSFFFFFFVFLFLIFLDFLVRVDTTHFCRMEHTVAGAV